MRSTVKLRSAFAYVPDTSCSTAYTIHHVGGHQQVPPAENSHLVILVRLDLSHSRDAVPLREF